MNQTSIVLVSTLLLVNGVSVAAAAGHNRDHLKCHRVAEQTARAAIVDLDTLPFGVDAGCTVTSAVRELCVPATSDVLAGGLSMDAIAGENLESERLCYRIKCPRRARPNLQVSDRFGTRTVAVGKPRTFCTAAVPVAEAP